MTRFNISYTDQYFFCARHAEFGHALHETRLTEAARSSATDLFLRLLGTLRRRSSAIRGGASGCRWWRLIPVVAVTRCPAGGQPVLVAQLRSVAVVLRRPRGFLLARARTCGASGCLLCRPLMPPVSPTRLPAGIQPVPVAQMHSVAFSCDDHAWGRFLTTFKQLL